MTRDQRWRHHVARVREMVAPTRVCAVPGCRRPDVTEQAHGVFVCADPACMGRLLRPVLADRRAA